MIPYVLKMPVSADLAVYFGEQAARSISFFVANLLPPLDSGDDVVTLW
jgi:hypothetical protein